MTSIDLCRKLRKEQTDAEKIFWEKVRNRRFDGKKFTRQYSIRFKINNEKRFFIADFFCAGKRLIVEIDGGIHGQQEKYDEHCTYLLNSLGYSVIRFKNEEVLNNIDSVLKELKNFLTHPYPLCHR